MCNTNPMVLIYQDSEGQRYFQSWEDLTEMGTLVDPETGDDMELIGWDSPQSGRGTMTFDEWMHQRMPFLASDEAADDRAIAFAAWQAALAQQPTAVDDAMVERATPASIRSMALEAAEAFIEGFADVEFQEGVDDLLDLIRLAKRVRECEEATLFAIARQGEPVFWSNTQGWVDVISCDLFTPAEVERVRLPLEGRWVRIG